MNLPTEEQIRALHNKYSPSDLAFEIIYTHSQVVADIATELIDTNDLALDKEVVRVSCLLHDIGAYRLIDAAGQFDDKNYIKHGVYGEEILRAEGFDDDVCRIASHHTGVGISKQEVIDRHLPLPPNDYLDNSPTETLVMYADKFHSKPTGNLPSRLNYPETYEAYLARFGSEKVERFKSLIKEFGVPDLKKISERYNQPCM